jgi:hypothetical protein
MGLLIGGSIVSIFEVLDLLLIHCRDKCKERHQSGAQSTDGDTMAHVAVIAHQTERATVDDTCPELTDRGFKRYAEDTNEGHV